MKVYIVFKHPPKLSVEIQGVFGSEQKAIKACRTWMHTYSQFTLNKELPQRRVLLKGYHPASGCVFNPKTRKWS
jgi:LmbE family N-acetylglucosaminyl deacetylase